MVPLPRPEAGLSVSHAALAVAVQFRSPPPVFLIARVCIGGLPTDCWAPKEKLVELTPMAGLGVTGGGVVREGGTSCFKAGISDISLSNGAGSVLVWLVLDDGGAATVDVAAKAGCR